MLEDSLEAIHLRLNRYQDSRLQVFESELSAILDKAQDATIARLLELLDLEGGVILQTPKNLKAMRRLSDIFTFQMDRFGYTRLVHSFVNSFPGQLPSVSETLDTLTKQVKTDLPEFTFNNTDLSVLKSVAAATTQSLQDVVRTEATKAMGRVMFGAGAMPFADMVSLIRESLGTTLARAKTLGDTAQATWYRVALDRQYQKIERGTGFELKYRYSGPVDLRERPFCRHLSALTLSGKTWTKERIGGMNNGQLANPFVTNGGFNCRHQWIPDLSDLLEAQAA